MNKAGLVADVAASAGITQTEADKVVNAIFTSIKETLAGGEKVAIAGFGTFDVSDRAAREGRNPKTGEKIQIAAAKAPKFSASAALKDAVNGK